MLSQVNQVHYSVLPALSAQVAAVGKHWAEDAWLPLEFPDPFGRAASVMPYDRRDRTHVLDDSRSDINQRHCSRRFQHQGSLSWLADTV